MKAPFLQPITYSFWINLAILAVLGLLACLFSQPLLVLAWPFMAQSAIGMFESGPGKRDPGLYDGSSGMGFLAPPDDDDDFGE